MARAEGQRTAGRDGLQAAVDTGRRHAADRLRAHPALRAKLMEAAVFPDPDLAEPLSVLPPSNGGRALIVYNPERLAELLAGMSYPEWVVAARIERLVLHAPLEWADGEDAGALAA